VFPGRTTRNPDVRRGEDVVASRPARGYTPEHEKSTVPHLLGEYSAPLVEIGQHVQCAIRGEVEVVGMSAGPIAWPIGRYPPNGRSRFLIVCGDLVDAIRRESAEAIRHHWRVGSNTVWSWRKALGISQYTEGTTWLKSKRAQESEGIAAAVAKLQDRMRDPEQDRQRREKIAAAKTGKARPAEVGQAIGQGHKGRKHSEESRRRMSDSHRRRGDGGANVGRPWTAEEDSLVRSLDAQEAARRTGRSVKAVWARRRKLGVNRVK
jgi:NUMOD3 motif